jgi:hypothetical protein
VLETIDVLGLNMQQCRNARRAYFDYYFAGEISPSFLERRAPFVAREMRRQGMLHAPDR